MGNNMPITLKERINFMWKKRGLWHKNGIMYYFFIGLFLLKNYVNTSQPNWNSTYMMARRGLV